MRYFVTAALFAATWLAWSGIYTPLLLTLGAVSCILVTILARRIGFFDAGLYSLHLIPRLPPLLFWLAKDLVKCNFNVARIVLSPRLPIEPNMMTIDAQDLTPVSRAILANSITLTPGSVVTAIDRGILEVHCLTRSVADEYREGELVRHIRRLEGS